MRTGLAIPALLSSIKPLSLNRVDTVHNEYTKLLCQFPELTRPTTKGGTVKHGIVTVRVLPLHHFCAVRPLFCVYIQTRGLSVCPGLPVKLCD